MKQLTRLHEDFIQKSERPMQFGRLPVSPRPPQAPIVPMDRWQECSGTLTKVYHFKLPEERHAFTVGWLEYERETQHYARVTLDELEATIQLQTRDIQRVTELDREAARFADQLYRDVVSRPGSVTSSADELDEPLV